MEDLIWEDLMWEAGGAAGGSPQRTLCPSTIITVPVPVMSCASCASRAATHRAATRRVRAYWRGRPMGVPRTTSWQLPRVRFPYYAHRGSHPTAACRHCESHRCECYVLPSPTSFKRIAAEGAVPVVSNISSSRRPVPGSFGHTAVYSIV